MSEKELLDEIAAIRAEVAQLREQIGYTGIRLGPQRETQAEIDRRTERLVETITRAVNPDAPPVDRSALCTTSGEPPEKVRAEQTEATGQHKSYIVLCDAERAKGFVRPYRDRYKHVGTSPQLMTGCGTVTTMGRALSETYARDPTFYGATFCCGCNRHLPVAEFAWTADGQQVGS